MGSILITGGTVFVSKYIENYFKEKNYEVYVLNRGSKEQIKGVNLICKDRNDLKNSLKGYFFDAIIDVSAYMKKDIENLLDAVGGFKNYMFISSSAVYPETNKQPFSEEQGVGENKLWGSYGLNKLEAEKYLISRVPNAYILRPAYIYGPMQNIYREPFVFECALNNRKFYIPKDGKMKLQFFHIDDLAKVLEKILEVQPKENIFNIGNSNLVDINTFVELCYEIVGTTLRKVYVEEFDQRKYFSFSDYEYVLDVSKQKELLEEEKDLFEGLKESFEWYKNNKEKVAKRDYISFIDENISKI